MSAKIKLTAISSFSPLGYNARDIWLRYTQGTSAVEKRNFSEESYFVAALSADQECLLNSIREDKAYKALDRSVLLAMQAARQLVQKASWTSLEQVGVNIGSSRGATNKWEESHRHFLENKSVPPTTSPLTTLGNISSWVGQDLKSQSICASHSVTCSTGLHSILNACAWLRAGFSERIIAGASEAALTAFSLAQMKALRIYSTQSIDGFACRPLAKLKPGGNSLCLGEGACLAALEMTSHPRQGEIIISGLGFYQERIESETAIDASGQGFQYSMRMALGRYSAQDIDLVIMHAPGTLLGDQAEINACLNLFQNTTTSFYSTKWALGHTFSASGMFSLEFACLCLHNGQAPLMPYAIFTSRQTAQVKRVLVNSAGFGGNCVSILIERIDE